MMTPETISALVLGITAIIGSVAVCLRRIHLRHLKMKTCCTDLSIDMGSSPRESMELQEITIEKNFPQDNVKGNADDKNNPGHQRQP